MSVMQDLYDSEIDVHLAGRRDAGWRVRISDPGSETGVETYVESWQDLEDWLIKQAISRFPNSEFAAKYRPRQWRRPTHLRLVDGARQS